MVDEFVVPLPDVSRRSHALRDRGIAIAILSNGWNPLQTPQGGAAPAFGGRCSSSSEHRGAEAGAARVRGAAGDAGNGPRQTWYVGDDPHCDVAGARAAGMRTVWLNWESKEYPPEIAPPDHTIVEFAELLALLPLRSASREDARARSLLVAACATLLRGGAAVRISAAADRSRPPLHVLVVRTEPDQRDRRRRSHV